jgi:hypothetical protein
MITLIQRHAVAVLSFYQTSMITRALRLRCLHISVDTYANRLSTIHEDGGLPRRVYAWHTVDL